MLNFSVRSLEESSALVSSSAKFNISSCSQCGGKKVIQITVLPKRNNSLISLSSTFDTGESSRHSSYKVLTSCSSVHNMLLRLGSQQTIV